MNSKLYYYKSFFRLLAHQKLPVALGEIVVAWSGPFTLGFHFLTLIYIPSLICPKNSLHESNFSWNCTHPVADFQPIRFHLQSFPSFPRNLKLCKHLSDLLWKRFHGVQFCSAWLKIWILGLWMHWPALLRGSVAG